MLRHGSATGHRPTLCCRIVLMALCVTCSFAPAWAATFVAAKAARVPHGRKAACIHGRPACAFVRQSRPKAPLREPFLPLLAPLHAALAAGGASVASYGATTPRRMVMRHGGGRGAVKCHAERSLWAAEPHEGASEPAVDTCCLISAVAIRRLLPRLTTAARPCGTRAALRQRMLPPRCRGKTVRLAQCHPHDFPSACVMAGLVLLLYL